MDKTISFEKRFMKDAIAEMVAASFHVILHRECIAIALSTASHITTT